MKGKTVIAIGPGLGRHIETAELVRDVALQPAVPTVLDADGLNAFEGLAKMLNSTPPSATLGGDPGGEKRTLVLTPHPGEMARLTGTSISAVQSDRLGVARRFAEEHACILVLKGHRTIVALPGGEAWINPTGNAGMATGGTGDILTGMVAGFLAQFPRQAELAVCAAVYLHGMAGDVARDQVGEQAMIATDLLKALPEAMRRTLAWSSQKLLRIS